jgi:hypothetical protein
VSRGQIFLDTRRISHRSGPLIQRFYQANKHPEPVLIGDREWERRGATLYGTVLYDEGRFKMWYLGRRMDQIDAGWTCYAESTDGIHWEKPELGIVEINGSRRNNVTDLSMYNASVVHDPHDPDPQRRYKCLGWVHSPRVNRQWGTDYPRSGYYTAHSPDGWHWTNDPGGPQIDLPHDEGRMVWDASRGRFIASVKEMYPYGFHLRRSVTISTSQDAVHWSQPQLALLPDELDDLQAQARGFAAADYYGLALYPRDELVVGMLWIHQMWPPFHPVNTSGIFSRVHVQLAYSYDGMNWQHPPGRPAFLDVGERGAFDSCGIYTANALLEVGDEVWIYYTGDCQMHGFVIDPATWKMKHSDPTTDEVGHMAIGLATIKRDRFASLSSDGEATFVVQHGLRGGSCLFLNGRTSGNGRIAVQIEHPDGTAIRGFGLHDCHPFVGDSVAEEVTWAGGRIGDLGSDVEIALRFELTSADLFSYRVED